MKIEGPNNRAKRLLLTLAEPRFIIFGVALLQFVWMLAFVIRHEWGFPVPADHWNPGRIMQEPLLVLFASFMLLIGRAWTYVLAIVTSAWVIYQLLYLGLVSISAAHDLPLLSLEVPRRWLGIIYLAQPQYILQIALSAVIMTFAALLLMRHRAESGVSDRTGEEMS